MRAALRSLALVVAIVAACGEALRSWGVDRPFFSVVDDYIMAGLLVVAALRSARKEGPALLSGAFGFASGMLYSSFFGHLEALVHEQADRGNIPQACLTVAIGFLFAFALVGFALSVREGIRAVR
jgi:hypothetical protein